MVHDNTHERLKFTTGEVFRRLVVCKVHFMLLKGTYTYTIFHHIYGLYIISANLFSQIQMTNRLYSSLVMFHGAHHVYSLLWRKLSFGNGRKSSINWGFPHFFNWIKYISTIASPCYIKLCSWSDIDPI